MFDTRRTDSSSGATMGNRLSNRSVPQGATWLASTYAACLVLSATAAQESPAQSSPAPQTARKSHDLLFSTYLGGTGGDLLRDITADAEGNIYVAGIAGSADFPRTPGALPGQSKGGGGSHFGKSDVGIVKIANDGTVLWATWIGGSTGNDWVASLGVGADRCPVIFANTFSQDMSTTAEAFCRTPGKSWVGKFSADGSKLLFGTYTGVATGTPFARTHNVAVDRQGNTFIAACTDKTWHVTPGALQTKFGGGPEDFGVMKLSPTGALLAASFLGGNGHEINGPDQIALDTEGNLVVAGSSSSTDYPVTAGAFQPRNAGASGRFPYDGVMSILSNDLSTLVYSSYIGGRGDEMARACCFGRDGTLHVGGVTTSNDFPTNNAFQRVYGGDPGFGATPNGGQSPVGWGNGDCWVAKFRPIAGAR
jgi:hypothetical protein